MAFSVSAFIAVILGVVFYCWFLSAQQRKLTRSVEMLERLQEQTHSSCLSNDRAA
jgi:CcmD family protein